MIDGQRRKIIKSILAVTYIWVILIQTYYTQSIGFMEKSSVHNV